MNILKELDAALAAAHAAKTASEGPQRNPSTHPTVTIDDKTKPLETGKTETTMAADAKMIAPAIVDNAPTSDTIAPSGTAASKTGAKIGSIAGLIDMLDRTFLGEKTALDPEIPAVEPNLSVSGGDSKLGPQVGLKQTSTGDDPSVETASVAKTITEQTPTTHPANTDGAPTDGVAFKNALAKRAAFDAAVRQVFGSAGTPAPAPATVPVAPKVAAVAVPMVEYLTGYGLAGLVSENSATRIKTAQEAVIPTVSHWAKEAYDRAMLVVAHLDATRKAASDLPPDPMAGGGGTPADPMAGPPAGPAAGGGGESPEALLENLINGLLEAGMSEEEVTALLQGGGAATGGEGGGAVPPPEPKPEPEPEPEPKSEPKTARAKAPVVLSKGAQAVIDELVAKVRR